MLCRLSYLGGRTIVPRDAPNTNRERSGEVEGVDELVREVVRRGAAVPELDRVHLIATGDDERVDGVARRVAAVLGEAEPHGRPAGDVDETRLEDLAADAGSSGLGN